MENAIRILSIFSQSVPLAFMFLCLCLAVVVIFIVRRVLQYKNIEERFKLEAAHEQIVALKYRLQKQIEPTRYKD